MNLRLTQSHETSLTEYLATKRARLADPSQGGLRPCEEHLGEKQRLLFRRVPHRRRSISDWVLLG
jgi:hypothetical protein